MIRVGRFGRWLLPLCLSWSAVLPMQAAFPPKPDPHFISDEGGLIGDETAGQIRLILGKLGSEKEVPVLVAVINRIAYGDGLDTFDKYAAALHQQWFDGHPNARKGILVLVGITDRKARIEMGPAWGTEKNEVCAAIMNELMVPNFKRGLHSQGVLAGVKGIDQMVRGNHVAGLGSTWWRNVKKSLRCDGSVVKGIESFSLIVLVVGILIGAALNICGYGGYGGGHYSHRGGYHHDHCHSYDSGGYSGGGDGGFSSSSSSGSGRGATGSW